MPNRLASRSLCVLEGNRRIRESAVESVYEHDNIIQHVVVPLALATDWSSDCSVAEGFSPAEKAFVSHRHRESVAPADTKSVSPATSQHSRIKMI